MLQAVVTLGPKVTEDRVKGHIIEAVALPWLELLKHIERDPECIYTIEWRKWEEIIAARYREEGYRVVLTAHSGDKGRDVIATNDLLSVRYFDQVKRYSPGSLIDLDQVHSMIGVLASAHNVSKGYITTTSDFAPGVYDDPEIKQFMPYRLELRPRDKLIEWLRQVDKTGE